MLIGPTWTERVGRRRVWERDSQYWEIGPYSVSRAPDFQDGVQRTSEGVISVDVVSVDAAYIFPFYCNINFLIIDF